MKKAQQFWFKQQKFIAITEPGMLTQLPLQQIRNSVREYLEFVLWNEKQSKFQYFQSFLEEGGVNRLMQLCSKYKGATSFFLQATALLIINIQQPMHFSCIVSQPAVQAAIALQLDPEDDQLVDVYLSLLKSLGLRIRADTVSLVYNQLQPWFPIARRAVRFYNHPDPIARTSAHSLILNLLKIDHPALQNYFDSFPFLSFYYDFSLWLASLGSSLIKQQSPQRVANLTDEFFLMVEYLDKNQDSKRVRFARSCLIKHFVFPLLFSDQKATPLKLYLLLQIVAHVRDATCLTTVVLALTALELDAGLLTYIAENLQVGQSYSSTFRLDSFWDQFQAPIDSLCLANFQTIVPPVVPADLLTQAQTISKPWGINILTGCTLSQPGTQSTAKLFEKSAQSVANPYRARLIEALGVRLQQVKVKPAGQPQLQGNRSHCQISTARERPLLTSLLAPSRSPSLHKEPHNQSSLAGLFAMLLNILSDCSCYSPQTVQLLCWLALAIKRNSELSLEQNEALDDCYRGIRRRLHELSSKQPRWWPVLICQFERQFREKPCQPKLALDEYSRKDGPIQSRLAQCEEERVVQLVMNFFRVRWLRTGLGKEDDLGPQFDRRLGSDEGKLAEGEVHYIRDAELMTCRLLEGGRTQAVVLMKHPIYLLLLKSHQNDSKCTVLLNRKHKFVQPSSNAADRRRVFLGVEEQYGVERKLELQFQDPLLAEGLIRFVVEARAQMTSREVSFMQKFCEE